MTDTSPEAVYLRMLDAWNDGTPETYGSTRFLDYYADDAVIEMTAMVGTPPQRGGKEVYRDGVTGGSAVFRNRHSDLLELLVVGERVAARLHWTATAAIDTPDFSAGATLHMDYTEFCTIRGGLITGTTAVMGPMVPEGGGAARSALTPKEVALRATEVFDGTIPGIDRYLEFFDEDAVWEFSPTSERPDWARIEGKQAARRLYHRVYSDRRDGLNETLNVVAEADLVVIEGRWTSTLARDENGIAAGTRRRHDCTTILTVRHGLIVQARQYCATPVVVAPDAQTEGGTQ